MQTFLLCLGLTLLPLCATAAGRRPSPPPPGPVPTGIGFNTSFGDNMVLQQAPAHACITGTIGPGGTGATVQIASASSAPGQLHHTYDAVAATIKDAPTPGYMLWKACLKPLAGTNGAAQAPEFTITATCTGCTNSTAATLQHVVFGDVWYVTRTV